MKTCYQCDLEVNWLAPDSRCYRCTRVTAEQVKGDDYKPLPSSCDCYYANIGQGDTVCAEYLDDGMGQCAECRHPIKCHRDILEEDYEPDLDVSNKNSSHLSQPIARPEVSNTGLLYHFGTKQP